MNFRCGIPIIRERKENLPPAPVPDGFNLPRLNLPLSVASFVARMYKVVARAACSMEPP